MSYEAIAIIMFAGMLAMLLTGQRVFAAIGFVSATASLFLYGTGAVEMPFNAAFNLFNWYPMLTLPMFIYMGYILSETGIANDLYRMFHVYFGGLRGGLAVGTIGLMVVISACGKPTSAPLFQTVPALDEVPVFSPLAMRQAPAPERDQLILTIFSRFSVCTRYSHIS